MNIVLLIKVCVYSSDFCKVCAYLCVCVCACACQEKEVQLRDGVSSLKGKSRDIISGFMGLFGHDGRIVSSSE